MSGYDIASILESKEKGPSPRSGTGSPATNGHQRDSGRHARNNDRGRSHRDDTRRTSRSPQKGLAHRSHRSRSRSRSRRRGATDPDPFSPTGNYHSSSREHDADLYGGSDRRRHGRSRSPRRDPSPSRNNDRYRPHSDYRDRQAMDTERARPRGGDDRARRSSPRRPTQEERDKRTIFVQQLAARLRTRQLIEFFEEGAGPVRTAEIVRDRATGRPKGIGYVEFEDDSSVAAALEMTGRALLGIPVIAQHAEAEKNSQVKTDGEKKKTAAPFFRLYVGNIHFSINEEDLRSMFENFGALEELTLERDTTPERKSKGYGFIQYKEPSHAREALSAMNKQRLAERELRVGLGSEKFTPEDTTALLRRFDDLHREYERQQEQGSQFSGRGGRGVAAGGGERHGRREGNEKAQISGASALDDTDVAGVNFSNFSRDSLMKKLARLDDDEDGAKQKAATQPKPKSPPANKEFPKTRCVVLQNVFDAAEEAANADGADWADEINQDVRGECEKNYGKVLHSKLDPNTGEIYIKFDRPQGGQNALNGLNGRLFGGRHISAAPVIEAVYDAKYGKNATN